MLHWRGKPHPLRDATEHLSSDCQLHDHVEPASTMTHFDQGGGIGFFSFGFRKVKGIISTIDSRRWRLKPVDQLDDTRMVHLPKCLDLRLVLARLLE